MKVLPSASHTQEVTGDNFNELVSRSEVPVLLEFWSPVCIPCNFMKGAVHKAAVTLGDEVLVGLVNVGEQPDLVGRYGVRGTPSFFVVRAGEVIDSFGGVCTAARLVDKVRSALG